MVEDPPLTEAEAAEARRRFRQMVALQELEGNPYDAEDLAMFEMFHHERWSHDRVHAYLQQWAAELVRKSEVVAAE